MNDPELVTYERWYAVYSSGSRRGTDEYRSLEEAAMAAVERIREGEMSATIYRSDRERRDGPTP